MSPALSRKRSIDSNAGFDDYETLPLKRRRSRSVSSLSSDPQQHSDFSSPPPHPSAHDLDRLNYHIRLQDFGTSLQKAANAIFPSDQLSRYSKVDVILLSWEEEDPNLPVSIEIEELGGIFRDLYGYNVEEWLIPAEDCHNKLQGKILEWLGESNDGVLKIVYYAGHGKLTNHGQPAWTSLRNSRKDRCPTVKWSGIQNTLEESRSDVFILLDCCSSGVCTTDEGNGVTELIVACAYNASANGVGPFSFTHALNTKLRQMAQLPYFTVGYLYNAIFTEIQGWRIEDSKHRKVPVHLVLSQNAEWPRSIRLANYSKGKGKVPALSNPVRLSTGGLTFSEPLEVPPDSHFSQPSSLPGDSISPFSQEPSLCSSGTSLSQLSEYPRLLFSIRLSEDVKPKELSTELFADWFRSVPVSASLIRVEAGFASDSTLLLLSMPPSMLAYLPLDRAITLLGTVRSNNLMAQPEKSPSGMAEETKIGGRVENAEEPVSKGPANVEDAKALKGSQTAVSNLVETSMPGDEGKSPTAYSQFPTELPSPYNHDDARSNSDSGYYNYQPGEFSEIEDPFFGVDFNAGVKRVDAFPSAVIGSATYQPASADRTNKHTQLLPESSLLAENNPSAHRPSRDIQGAFLSPGHSSAASTPRAQTDEEEITSVYSLPIDNETQVVLAKMKPAYLSLNGPMFGGDIPEDIGYEMYKLGTLIQALNPKRPEIDSGW